MTVAAIAFCAAPPAYAQCVTLSLLSGEAPEASVDKAGLVFSGTVTATDLDRYTVSLTVDRVWKGDLRRNTTLFVAPVIEGAHAGAFVEGERYLVTANGPTVVYGPQDVAATELPAGTIGVAFGCTDGPVPLADAGQWLKRLGRARSPLP